MINNIRYNEDALYKLRRRKIALGEMQGEITGYPSIDMPWLKYYTEEQILAPIPRELTALEYLKILNNNNLHLPAIEFLGKQMTYLELFKKINDTTKSLHALGVKPGEIVTIMLPACPEEVFLFYAIDQLGACANFIFPGTPLQEVEKTMEEFNSTKLFILDDILQQPNTLINNFAIDIVTTSITGERKVKSDNLRTWENFDKLAENTEMPIYKRNPEEPLFIAKTGGSTGKPKSVVLSDQNFNLQVQQQLNSPIDYSCGDRWVRLWPLFSASAAVSSSHLPLCYGMLSVLEPYFDINKIDEIVMNSRPAHMPLISSGINVLMDSRMMKGKDLSFIKTLGIGGEGVTTDFEERAEEFLQEHNIKSCMTYGYGMTENSSAATSRFNRATSAPGSVGVPLVNTIVSAFDLETDEELKYGQEGEICVLSSTFMVGYFGNEHKINEVFKMHSDGNIWLHTGDIGYLNEDGKVFIKGRKKRVIFIFTGEKVYPLDIEELIETIDSVDNVVIVAEPDPEHDGALVPCCFVTLTDQITQEELRNKISLVLKEKAASYVKINNIYIKDKFPKTDMGKVDWKKLEEEAKILSKKKQ
ncbi:MAG: class I adenylate-forming enzyme family protein [Candidatus Coprovivens sp.]